MKRFLCKAVLLLIVLLLPAGLLAEDNSREQQELSQIQETLNEYREEGYELLGPMQYLGKTQGKIKFYRHSPVSYRLLDTFDKAGEEHYVKKHDFVYVLSKHGHVVLIHLDKEDQGDV